MSVEQWREVCELYQNRCLRCGLVPARLVPDHVIPLAKGGTNYIENIQPLCFSCNVIKKDDCTDYRPQSATDKR
ncbi:MAG: HNH endonuclease signature motif containing protein [Armatimonadota bacterium]